MNLRCCSASAAAMGAVGGWAQARQYQAWSRQQGATKASPPRQRSRRFDAENRLQA